MSQALTDTYGNYHNEMEGTFASLRKQATQLQEDLPNMVRDIQPQSEEIVKAVKATGKVTGPQRVVVEVFAWSSVMVMATGVGSMFGAYLLGPFVSLFFGKFFASLLAFLIIPVFSHVVIRNAFKTFLKRERHFESDNKIRTSMLVTSLIQGVLAGYAIDSYYLSAQPLASITPAVVSVGYTISVRQSHGNRFQVLGFSLGAAFLVNLILGAMFVGNTLSYQFLTLGYVAIAGFMLQLVLHDIQMTRGHPYQNALASLYLIFKGATFYCFGTYIE